MPQQAICQCNSERKKPRESQRQQRSHKCLNEYFNVHNVDKNGNKIFKYWSVAIK